MNKIRIITNKDGEYVSTLRINAPAICEKCGHEVEIFKADNFGKNNEELLTKCFTCGNEHMIVRPHGFWWLYSSVLAWDMMYKDILKTEE